MGAEPMKGPRKPDTGFENHEFCTMWSRISLLGEGQQNTAPEMGEPNLLWYYQAWSPGGLPFPEPQLDGNHAPRVLWLAFHGPEAPKLKTPTSELQH